MSSNKNALKAEMVKGFDFSTNSLDQLQLSSVSSSSNSSSANLRRVRFKNVNIREYNRTIGDNPSCSSGCPLSIGWHIQKEFSISLDLYEDTRPPRRERVQFQVPRDVRQEMLMNEWDIPFATIRRTIIEVSREREIRLKTMRKMQQSAKIDTFIKKLLLCGNSRGTKVTSTYSSSKLPKSQDTSMPDIKKIVLDNLGVVSSFSQQDECKGDNQENEYDSNSSSSSSFSACDYHKDEEQKPPLNIQKSLFHLDC